VPERLRVTSGSPGDLPGQQLASDGEQLRGAAEPDRDLGGRGIRRDSLDLVQLGPGDAPG
jgi:hypothetical protein